MANRKKDKDPETVENRKKIYKRIVQACKEGDTPLNAVAFIADVNANTVQSMRSNKDMSLYSLIKLADVLGYEVVLARKADHVNWREDPKKQEKYKQFKSKQLDAKRKQRGLPTGKLPIKFRIKKRKSGATATIVSRRAADEVQQQQGDFLSFT